MKIQSCIILRPATFLIFLILVVLSLPVSFIPLWMHKARKVETQADLITRAINQELAFGVQKAAAFFSPINTSTINLIRYLNSSFDANQLGSFPFVQSKVAPTLFQTLLTVPYLSHVSYVGFDGLLFAYYSKEGKPFAVYSNATFPTTTLGKGCSWYGQPASLDTGEPYGEAMTIPPSSSFNSTWFSNDSWNTTTVNVSIEAEWRNSSELMLLSTAGIHGMGSASLGISVKTLIEFFSSGISFYNASLILSTKDGRMLTPGLPNTRVLTIGDGVSFRLLGMNGDQLSVIGNITCTDSNHGSSSKTTLSIRGQKYTVECCSVQIAGLKLVCVLAIPYNELSSVVQSNVVLVWVLLILMVGLVSVTICIFMYLILIDGRREMYLCGALIKQMEATQQAERKSMNKSLAFAGASHDIRASLSCITSLIEMSRAIIPKRGAIGCDVHTNFHQMEACSKDLLGILNSILDTSKIEAGKMQLEEEEFDVGQVVEDVVDLFHSVGAKKGVDVILDPHDGSILKSSRVKGDRGKLKQILCNLMSNAVKFTAQGHVVVRAWARKPSLENEIIASCGSKSTRCMPWPFRKNEFTSYSESEVVKTIQCDPNCMEFIFEVNDTGRGIPKEHNKSVFENYVQVKETTPGKEGTGLGLGIVQSLVRLMGGDIGIVDKDVGEEGTCFRFNSFFSCSDSKVVDVETHGDYLSSSSSPKFEVLHAILFIRGEKRSNVMRRFMERIGVKVDVVRHQHQLSTTLKRAKRRLNLTQYSSSKSDINSTSRTSSARSQKEVPLSALDGADSMVWSSLGKRGARGDSVKLILIVLDTGAGPFREMGRAVAEFRKDLNHICRVLWLEKSTSSENIAFEGLDQRMLPQSDMVMFKPFHGSRMYRIMGLLPGCHDFSPPRKAAAGEIEPLEENVEKGVESGKTEKSLANKKILVVDDDPIGLRIATLMASQLGATTFSCKNGKEAVVMVCKGLEDGTLTNVPPFDCIFMDCEMPVLNGVEATRRIRQEEKSYHVRIPIVALTAHDKGEEMKMMIEAGVDDFLTKPLSKDNLFKVVSKLVR